MPSETLVVLILAPYRAELAKASRAAVNAGSDEISLETSGTLTGSFPMIENSCNATGGNAGTLARSIDQFNVERPSYSFLSPAFCRMLGTRFVVRLGVQGRFHLAAAETWERINGFHVNT